MPEKVLLNWSSGKESALCLYQIRQSRDYEIVALLTTITEDYDRVSMHGVRRILLEKQAESLNIPIEKVFIKKNYSNNEYESRIKDILKLYKKKGILSAVFGDIYLLDVRRYREDNLKKAGIKAIFPLWKKDTFELANLFIDLGFKAIITCIDSHALDREFVGREFDKGFLNDLPAHVDPCGENGEFHTFVYEGPIFKHCIHFKKGEVVLRDNRFYFCDLLPKQL